MIRTVIVHHHPLVLYHQVSGKISAEEALAGAQEGIKPVKRAVVASELVYLILDMRDHEFSSIDARRIWSTGFKEHRLLKEKVHSVAVVGDDTPVLHTEKEMMESDVMKFFTDLRVAMGWIASCSSTPLPPDKVCKLIPGF